MARYDQIRHQNKSRRQTCVTMKKCIMTLHERYSKRGSAMYDPSSVFLPGACAGGKLSRVCRESARHDIHVRGE